MKIKNIEFSNNVFLAPMAGVTSYAFRSICKEMGAGAVYCEMVSDKGLTYHNAKTLNMINVLENEHPVVMQLFGSDKNSLLEAAKIVEANSNVDIIDINMGCPVKKVTSNGSGSALLKDPNKIYDIIKTLVDNINLPITCKIRTGWDHDSINCVEVAKIIEKAGASAITIHGRTRSDLYNGHSDWSLIKKVKEAVSIPVIGNGDIIDEFTAKRMIDETGVDGIMIARAACGNPWIFKRITSYLKDGTIIDKPSKKEVLDIMIEHANRLVKEHGEYAAIVEMRTHAAFYLKNLIGTKNYKVRIVNVSTINELIDIKNEILNDEHVYSK